MDQVGTLTGIAKLATKIQQEDAWHQITVLSVLPAPSATIFTSIQLSTYAFSAMLHLGIAGNAHPPHAQPATTTTTSITPTVIHHPFRPLMRKMRAPQLPVVHTWTHLRRLHLGVLSQ